MVSSLLYSTLPDMNTGSQDSARPKISASVQRPIRGSSSSGNPDDNLVRIGGYLFFPSNREIEKLKTLPLKSNNEIQIFVESQVYSGRRQTDHRNN